MIHAHDTPSQFHARWSEDRQVAQLLKRHLVGVAECAECLADQACPSDGAVRACARLAGLLHDLGKYRTEFQTYLDAGDRGRRSTDTAHAVYGAAVAENWGLLAVAYAIAGHHAGLHNQSGLAAMLSGSTYQAQNRWPQLLKFANQRNELAALLKAPHEEDPTTGLAKDLQTPNGWIEFDDHDPDDSRRFEVYTRILFSILVDADRLDSEKFEQEHRRKRMWERVTKRLDAVELLAKLEESRRNRSQGRPADELNRLRNGIYAACISVGSDKPPGFFTLTVPTGGGKTLSSMAFALAHAKQHSLRRVIVVIPYLSIIEQNACDYRTIFGVDQVLEHHSAVELMPQKRAGDGDEDEPPQSHDIERAMENWDVPIVVTTSVQFIETLFAASPSKARKLHNIVRSVIVFDEVQTLPTHLLEPTLDVLRTLQKDFGVSVLFCSATQPGFRKSGNLSRGFREGEVLEISPTPSELFQKLRRVQYRIEPKDSSWNWHRLADEMLNCKRQQGLAVLNLRQHAFDAYQTLRDRLITEGRTDEAMHAVFHLSSAMCAAHRLDKLGLSLTPLKNNVKQRLEDKLPCWVISTQLIEAGVDIDFPAVFRAMGPLDSIVQAAGRCNREGQLRDDAGNQILGDVIVFHPEVTSERNALPPGNYSKATGIAPNYLNDTERLATDPDLFTKYFHELFQITATDRVRPREDTIQQSRAKLNFRTVAERAKVISEDTIGVIVPYGRAKKLIAVIRRTKRLDRGVLRRLQRFMVNLRRGPMSLYEQLNGEGRLQSLLPDVADIPVLDAECYDSQRGVVFKERSPEDFVQ